MPPSDLKISSFILKNGETAAEFAAYKRANEREMLGVESGLGSDFKSTCVHEKKTESKAHLIYKNRFCAMQHTSKVFAHPMSFTW